MAALLLMNFQAFAQNDKEKLAAEVSAMIVDLSCDNDAECQSFGFGNKPCGGYQEYRIYSTKTADSKILLEKAEQYKILGKESGEGSSTCEVTQKIHAACIRKQCVSMGDDLNFVTPVHYAVGQNDTALIAELMTDGHDINALSVTNETPLLYAVQNNTVTPETVKFLIDKGADVNFHYDEKSNSALIYAVIQKRLDMIKILLDHGADPKISNHWGDAVAYAKAADDEKVLKIFSNRGFK